MAVLSKALRIIVDMAAVLDTMYDLRDEYEWVPKSPIYLAMDSSMERFLNVQMALITAKLVEVRGDEMRLTALGREKAEKLVEARQAADAEWENRQNVQNG